MTRRSRGAWTAPLAMLLAATASQAQAPDPSAVIEAIEQATTAVADRAGPSVVSIGRLSDESPAPPVFGPFGPRAGADQPDWREWFGTGVILERPGDPSGRYVLTNRHVIAGHTGLHDARRDAGRLAVVLPGRQQIGAEVIAADPRSDLAVLRLDPASGRLLPEDLPAFEFGEAEGIRKGHLVWLLGNPYAVARDGSASISLATVANVSRSPWNGIRRALGDDDLTIHHLGTLWHLDSRINLGSSGGAVVDVQGRLIGLTTALAALEGYESSVGYAVPFTPGFRRIVDSLLQGYEVEYGFLGIAPRTSIERLPARSGRPSATAAVVAMVADGSPANAAELERGDFIFSVNGVPLSGEEDLIREIGLLGPDAIAHLEIGRPRAGGIIITAADVRLGKWPVYDDTLLIATQRRREPWRGLQIDYPTARRRYLPTELFDHYPQAVVVTHVDPGSVAASAGFQEGLFIAEVNGIATTTPGEFMAAVRDIDGAATIRLGDGREIRLNPQ